MENKDKLRVKVILLPTEKATELYFQVKHQMLVFGAKQINTNQCQNQHLYFISEREIKEDDCFIGVTPEHTNTIVSSKNKHEYVGSGTFVVVRKIEATTDPSLNLPLIPDSFVTKYVEKQGDIKEVMIELADTNGLAGGPSNKKRVDGLYLRMDNTVIISPVKDSRNNEEVASLIRQMLLWCDKNDGPQSTYVMDYETVEKWIKDNL